MFVGFRVQYEYRIRYRGPNQTLELNYSPLPVRGLQQRHVIIWCTTESRPSEISWFLFYWLDLIDVLKSGFCQKTFDSGVVMLKTTVNGQQDDPVNQFRKEMFEKRIKLIISVSERFRIVTSIFPFYTREYIIKFLFIWGWIWFQWFTLIYYSFFRCPISYQLCQPMMNFIFLFPLEFLLHVFIFREK